MGTLALLVVAALASTLLAGVMELAGARRARRRLLDRASPVLHPLSHHRLPRLRYWSSRRAIHHVALFVAFLTTVYLAMTLLKALRALLARWF